MSSHHSFLAGRRAGLTLALLLGAQAAEAGPAVFGSTTTLATASIAENVNAGDLDGDGDLDLVVSNGQGSSISVLRNDGNATFQPQVAHSTGSTGARSSAIADFNHDGKLDVAVACLEGQRVSVLLGLGNGAFQAPVRYVAGQHPFGVTARDVDMDGHPDLAVACHGTGNVTILRGNGNGTFQAAVPYASGSWTYWVAFGRFDGDSAPDMASVNLFGNTVTIRRNAGNGTFLAPVVEATGTWPKHVSAADLDADGDDDLVVSNDVGQSLSILRCNGDGTFQPAVAIPLTNCYATAVADFNSDGILDLATANRETASTSILLGNGDATFGAPATMSAGGSTPQSVLARDLNGDGRPDLALALALDNRVSVRTNSTPWRPNANAGPDQTVPELASVTLDGSASNGLDQSTLTYAWSQVAGPSATLSDATSPTPTFSAPDVATGGSTLTFSLVVTGSGLASAPDTVNVTVTNVNHAPVALAGTDQAVAEGALVTLDASASYDQDGEALAYSWVQVGGPAVALGGTDTANPTFSAPFVGHEGADLLFEVAVSDGAASSVDTVVVRVDDVNHAPVAMAGDDQTANEVSAVTLLGSGSDPDSDAVDFAWTQVDGPAVTLSDSGSASPTFMAPSVVGVESVALTFRLLVSDGYGGSDDDEVVVNVRDTNAPPACGLGRASVGALWPPTHVLQSVTVTGVTDPDGPAVLITITGVTQDEPVDGLGDGDTRPDAVLQGGSVLVRSERSGNGNGRVYRVAFSADDGVGGTCTGVVRTSVPKNRSGNGSTAVEDAGVHVSTQY